MRGFYGIVLGVLFVSLGMPAFGQVSGDTLGLKGTVADTVVADKLFAEMKGLIKERKWEEATTKAHESQIIYIKAIGINSKKNSDVLYQLGYIQFEQGNYDNTLTLWDSVLNIRLMLFGKKHNKVSLIYNNIGVVYREMGKYAQAIKYHQKSLNISKELLGMPNPENAYMLNNIGKLYRLNSQYDSAKYYHHLALCQFPDSVTSIHPQISDAYSSLGLVLNTEERNIEALYYYNKALKNDIDIFGINSPEVAGDYNNIGNVYSHIGKYEKALDYIHRCLDIELKTYGDIHPNVATTFNDLAIAYFKSSNFGKAEEYFNKALQIRLKFFPENNPDIVQSYNNLGSLYDKLGEYSKALEYLIKAQIIIERIQGIDNFQYVAALNNIGILYLHKGHYEKAINTFENAILIQKNILGEYHPEVGKSYHNIAVVKVQNEDVDGAIYYLNKALDIYLRSMGENHPEIGVFYHTYASIYTKKEEYYKAIEYEKKAIQIDIANLGLETQELSSNYAELGSIYRKLEIFDSSEYFLNKSLMITQKNLGQDHPDNASLYNKIGLLYQNQNKFTQAIDYYNKALINQSLNIDPFHPDVAYTYANLGECFYVQSKLEDALSNFKKSFLILNSDVKHSANIFAPLDGLYKTFKAIYLHNNSNIALLNAYDNAMLGVKILTKFKSISSEFISNSFWLSESHNIYEKAINISLIRSLVEPTEMYKRQIFPFSEQSKAATLQSAMREGNAIHFANIPDSLLQKEHDLRIDITWREKQRQALLDKGLSETDTNALRISSIIFDLKRDYEALKQRFETEYPEYYRLKYDLSTVSLQYVQDTLLESQNQALLEYFVGDSSIFLFVVRPDTMIVEEVKRDFPLEDWIQGLRHGLYGYYTTEKLFQTDSLKADARSKYLEFAPKLYEKLVAPVAQYLPEKVILVPDGPLGYVPFDALLTGAPEDLNNFKSYPYLLQKHQFSYTYSATLLREMRDKKHRQEPEKDFIAFAPFYNGDTTLLASMYAYDELMRKDLQPLAYTGPEVAAASKLMRGETIAGAAATEERFTSMASDYRIIHLATHGRADNRVGDYAFLAFTEIKDSIENELLYVKDLYNLSLNADLVVLSACETGIGKLQRGEGIISLARAFAYAGAKSIVTSLWSVNDKSTSELMRFFYRELKRGKDKDEALRLARLRFLKESSVRNSHPFFWAAFVPIGDMRPVR